MNTRFEGRKYCVSIKSAVIIRMIQIKLKIIRFLRSRKFFGVESIVLLFTMTAIWMLCALAIYTIEDNRLEGTTLCACLWSLKEEYISTVVIVIAMRVCSNVLENRKKLKMQHRSYYDLMTSADHLFEPALGDFIPNYMAFYNNEMLHGTIDFISSRVERFEIQEEVFYNQIKNIILELDSIRQQYYSGNLVISDEEAFVIRLKDTILATECISPIEIIETHGDALIDLSIDLLLLIDELREPWRKDINDRRKIICLLYDNNKKMIEESFYLRMHVLTVEEIYNCVLENGY